MMHRERLGEKASLIIEDGNRKFNPCKDFSITEENRRGISKFRFILLEKLKENVSKL